MTEQRIADDDLIAIEVGPWANEKHGYLRRYLNISSATRKKFLDGSSGSATYIDLFCGPGRALMRDTGEYIDGSAVAAWKISQKSETPFSKVYIADINPEYRSACAKRLRCLGAPVVELQDDAINAAQKVIKSLNPYGLHFALLDPYNLDALDFEIIQHLATLKRIDMLIHVSAMDLQRNLQKNINAENSALDSFAPGWKEQVNLARNQENIRREIIEYWQELIEQTGKSASLDWELITGNKNQRLYWLLLVADNTLAKKFWKIATQSNQGELFK